MSERRTRTNERVTRVPEWPPLDSETGHFARVVHLFDPRPTAADLKGGA